MKASLVLGLFLAFYRKPRNPTATVNIGMKPVAVAISQPGGMQGWSGSTMS